MKGFNIKYWAIPILLAVTVTAAAKTGLLTWGNPQKQVLAAQATSVTAESAQMVSKIPKLSLTGSVEGETSAVISAKIAGRIEQILVEDGQPVTAGQPLIRLESVELSNNVRTGSDAVRRASANYENVETDYKRYQTLYAQNAISKQVLDGIETKLKVAQADLSSAEAALSTAGQQYAYALVTAPVSGVVANKTAVIGQVVGAGAPLMSVENIGQVYAVVNVEQKDLGAIGQGMAAEITVDAYPDKVFAGKIQIINPAAVVANRMYKTKIKIDNSQALLKPGMFVKVSIVTGKPALVLAVPQAAIFQKQGIYQVYVLENGKAIRRQVEVGAVLGDFVEIKTDLEAKAEVITSNVNKLKDGDAVQVGKP
ncbi:efflux RND transporter periplasmic adaptor subunit [Sporomusa malonica]|uniref:RND family efflux transporter, MFP subunit n=1 Tax=Sporomusa malonica TaxID=112901 RepID=A0A1W2EHD1_9FIRM|nr:efflux RND transporter periplasmic adaptor subunit [Sporomusa malonica]SMD09099.1 RND family efflux transporter, MFP subunit [Sporomusa malonica]